MFIGIYSILICCYFCFCPVVDASSSPAQPDELRFVALLHRHGSRTPRTGPMKEGFKWIWNDGLNRLTQMGLGMDYKMGLQLRKRYLLEAQLMDTGLQAQESDLLVMAAESDVAQQSAAAVLRGMFGMQGGTEEEQDLQSVPVHGSGSRTMDGWRHCPTTLDLIAQLHASPDWAEQESSVAWKTTQASLTGMHVVPSHCKAAPCEWELEWIESLIDWIHCANASDPAEGLRNALPVGLAGNPALMDRIVTLGNWVRTAPFRIDSINGLGELSAGVLLSRILEELLQFQAQPESGGQAHRIMLFFVHSQNMMGFFRLLRLFDLLDQPPLFSSTFALELWKNGADQSLYLRLRLNDVEFPVPNCPDATTCSLRTFLSMNDGYLNLTRTQREWDAVCEKRNDACSLGPLTPSNPIVSRLMDWLHRWLFAGILAGIIVTVLVMLIVWRWWRNRSHRSRQETMKEMELNLT